MSAIELQVYDIFKVKFGEKEASKILELFTTITSEKIESQTQIFERIVNKDIEVAKQELRREVADSKTEIIKWMFIFWASQIAATIGFVMLYLKRPI